MDTTGAFKNYALKMGRQELIYDDQRLLGNLDWGNLTISHDALLLKYENKDKHFQWHIGVPLINPANPCLARNIHSKIIRH